MDIIEELKEIITMIDRGDPLGTYEAGMLEIAINRLEQTQPAWHPEQPVRRLDRLFPGRQVVTSGPDGEGLFPLYAVANSTAKVEGKFQDFAELCFDWENPL